MYLGCPGQFRACPRAAHVHWPCTPMGAADPPRAGGGGDVMAGASLTRPETPMEKGGVCVRGVTSYGRVVCGRSDGRCWMMPAVSAYSRSDQRQCGLLLQPAYLLAAVIREDHCNDWLAGRDRLETRSRFNWAVGLRRYARHIHLRYSYMVVVCTQFQLQFQ